MQKIRAIYLNGNLMPRQYPTMFREEQKVHYSIGSPPFYLINIPHRKQGRYLDPLLETKIFIVILFRARPSAYEILEPPIAKYSFTYGTNEISPCIPYFYFTTHKNHLIVDACKQLVSLSQVSP